MVVVEVIDVVFVCCMMPPYNILTLCCSFLIQDHASWFGLKEERPNV